MKHLFVFILSAVLATFTACNTQTPGSGQAHDNAGSCASRPLNINPVAYEQGPTGYDYVYATALLDADCNVIRKHESLQIDILGHYTDPKTALNVEFWNVVFKLVDSPYSEHAPHIPKTYHSVLGDTTIEMDENVIDDLGVEFLECQLFRDGRPVGNDIRAVGRAIKVVKPGTTIVECNLAGELD